MMSSSMELVGNRRFSGNKGFSLTCSRLSQYLKENGSFGDLSLGIACKPESNNGTFGISRQPTTTMSLFPCEASNMAATEDVKPKDLFPRQQSSFSSSSSSVPKEMTQTTTRSVKPESQTAPLTIFYAGQVIVFNEFSVEKAKEIMDLATKGSANSFTSNLPKNQTEIRTQEPIQSIATPMACELPIARRASLHRFLEKRKDRVTSKAPYQLCDPSKASSKPQAGDNKTSWLGFAAQR